MLYTPERPSGTFLWSPLLRASKELAVTHDGRGKEEACDMISRGAAIPGVPA